MSISGCPTRTSSTIVARLHGQRLSARQAVGALRVSDPRNLSAAASSCRLSREQTSWRNIKLGLIMLRNIFWKVGVLGDYKREFWKFALAASGARRDRISDQLDSGGAPFDHVRARRFGRAAERVELLDAAARGVGPGRVTPLMKTPSGSARGGGVDPSRGRANPVDNRRFEATVARRGAFALWGALARRGGDLLHLRAENFPHVFKSLAPIRRGQFSLIRAREFELYTLSRCENWTGHA